MKLKYFLYALFFALAAAVFAEAENPAFASGAKKFTEAPLEEKAGILSGAASLDFFGQLCEFALKFALGNPERAGEPAMSNLIIRAAKGIGDHLYSPAAETLWETFIQFNGTSERIEIINALVLVAEGDRLAGRLNRLVEEENEYEERTDYPLLRTLIKALGKTGDENSYQVLFQTLLIPYNDELLSDAKKSLASVAYRRGDVQAFFEEIIRAGPLDEKLAAFRLGVDHNIAGSLEKGSLAEAALKAGLDAPRGDGGERYLRMEAARVIEELKWVYALPLAFRYYSFADAAFRASGERAEKTEFLAAAGCLAAMGDAGAARTLSLRLGLINSTMEFSGEYDGEIVLALIDALGGLGYRAAFDNLSYVGLLPYPETIKKRAAAALKRLW